MLKHYSDPESEWVFTKNGHRLTTRDVNYVLEKYAKSSGSPKRLSHTLRKTCGSNLIAKGFTLKEAANYLGDTLEVFIKHYCYSVNDEEHLQSLLNK